MNDIFGNALSILNDKILLTTINNENYIYVSPYKDGEYEYSIVNNSINSIQNNETPIINSSVMLDGFQHVLSVHSQTQIKSTFEDGSTIIFNAPYIDDDKTYFIDNNKNLIYYKNGLLVDFNTIQNVNIKTFNTIDIASATETISASQLASTTQQLNQQIQQLYLPLVGGTISQNLSIQGILTLQDGTTQSTAFSSEKNTSLNECVSKLSNISFLSNTTKINGNIELDDDVLTIQNINGLSNSLNSLQSEISNLSSDITNLTNSDNNYADDILSLQNANENIQASINNANLTIASSSSLISTINNTLGIISGQISNNLNGISTNTSSISSINSTINEINTSINDIKTNIVSINTNLSLKASKAEFDDLNSIFADVSNNNGNLIIANDTTINDLLINNSFLCDGTFSIDNIEYCITNQQMSYLKNISSDVQGQINTINTNLTSINNTNTIQDGNILSHSNLLSSHANSINTINDHIDIIDNSINTINSSVISINSTLNNNTTSIGDIESDITSLNNAVLANINSINTINNEILNLQPELTSTNRLNTSFIADGSITNSQFQTLYNINTGSSIETRLSDLETLTNTLNGLQNGDALSFTDLISNVNDISNTLDTFQFNQTSTNSNYASEIASLQNSVISETNKLNSDFVQTSYNSNSILSDALDYIQTQIDTANTAISALQLYDTNNSTNITNLTNTCNTNTTNLTNREAHDVIQDGRISTLENDVLDLTNSLSNYQPIINSNNKLSSQNVSTNINSVASTLDTILSQFDDDLQTLDAGKQNILNNTDNKLPIDYVDLSGSALNYVDINSSLSSQLTAINGNISTLTTLQNNDITNFTNIQNNFDDLDTQIAGLQPMINNSNKLSADYVLTSINTSSSLSDALDYIETQISNISAQNGSIPSISYASNETTITGTTILNTLQFGDASEQTTAYSSEKNTNLSNCVSKLTNISYDTNTTTISGDLVCNSIIGTTIDDINTILTNIPANYQTIINDTDNKLPIDYVDLTGNALNYVDINASLSSSLSDINSSITAINTFNISQSGLNDGFTSSINSINTSITNLENGKQDTISDGDLSISKTYGLQNELNSKSNILNPSFTGILTEQKICENISYSNNYTFSSNVLTYSYNNNNALIFFNSLTNSTNFQISLIDLPTDAYKSYTITLIIDVETYKAYANTCSVNGSNYIMIAGNGLSNLSVNSNSVLALQTITIFFTSSNTPFKVLTSISSMF